MRANTLRSHLEFLASDNRKVLSYVRCTEEETILCVVDQVNGAEVLA